jgi:retron-type reverse transcriptase
MMINMCFDSHVFIHYLLSLYNSIISSHHIPKTLKRSRIVPIPKKPNPSTPNDMRPIAIQPVLTKLFEKCLMPSLNAYLEDNNLISKHQFGFRKKHSTSHAIIAITDFMYASLAKGNVCIVVTLDLRKAFHKVDRKVLVHKLQWYGIDSRLIDSLLKDRSQFVSLKCEGECKVSETKETQLGVPQGGCVSCVLFSLMINDLCLVIKNALPVLYADDDTLLIDGPPADVLSLINKLEEDLSRTLSWLLGSKLILNDDKTEVMFVGKKSVISRCSQLHVHIHNKIIKRVESMKILGVMIDSNLKWDKHLSKITQSCNYSLSLLYPLRSVLSYSSRKLLISSLTLSHLHYVSSVWFNSSTTNRTAIDRISRRAAKFVLNKDKYDSVSNELNCELKWLNCKNRLKFETLKLAFNMIHNSGPAYFLDYLCPNAFSSHETRRGSYVLHNQNLMSCWGERSFRYSASKLWFELPDNLKLCDSFVRFKSSLYLLLLTSQTTEYNSQCDDNVCDLSCIDSVLYSYTDHD